MDDDDYTLLQDPCIKYPHENHDSRFGDYILQCKTLIRNTRLDLKDNPFAEEIIAANAPFELTPKNPIFLQRNNQKIKCGALVTHGLYDSPLMMKDIGLHLQSEGFLVRSVLLPGHGTVPGGLLNVTYESWLEAVQYGIASFANEVDRLFLVGYSTGASLSLYHTLQQADERIAGLILLAPAIKLYSSLGFAANWLHQTHIDEKWERARWLLIAKETDYAKYESMTLNSVNQVMRLMQDIQTLSKTHTTTCPLFVAVSQDDRTISSTAALDYFQQHAPDNSQFILYTTEPQSTQDSRIVTRPAAYPEWNIDNMSHIAIPIAPENPHYGKHGDYSEASHIEENCQQDKKYIYGSYHSVHNTLLDALSTIGFTKHEHRRLTFNPDFDFLKQAISRFMISLL